jgi:drug/metabolite transporter superfamily protein YnfA
MRFNKLLLIFALVSLGDGVIAILAPGPFMNFIWPHRAGAEANLFIQGWGCSLMALSVIAWLMSGLKDSASRRVFALGVFIYFSVAAVVWLLDGLSMGWTPLSVATLAGLGLFALAFGYFRFVKPGSL